jgi:hypothetical protein
MMSEAFHPPIWRTTGAWIAESERDPKRDKYRHKMLLSLLAEETAKDKNSISACPNA